MNIWDFWATKYNRLWVQRYSLTPTREYLLKVVDINRPLKILDLGCGPGELIEELLKTNNNLDLAATAIRQQDYDTARVHTENKRRS